MAWKVRRRKRYPYLNPEPPILKMITIWCWASHCTVCLINLHLISINSDIIVSIVMRCNLIVRELHGSFVSVTVYCLSLETRKLLRTEQVFCLFSHYSLFFLLCLSPYILLLLFRHCSLIFFTVTFFLLSVSHFFKLFIVVVPPFFPCLSLCFFYSSSLSGYNILSISDRASSW
jgi:hypothetical protein